MSEPQRQDVSIGESGAPAGKPVRDGKEGWRAKLRWFAAEYLIVVFGVLTAVAINAWWQGRSDHKKEQSYLRQLAADLRQTERDAHWIDSVARKYDRYGARLLESCYLIEPPPEDTLARWLSMSYLSGILRPVISTAEALVASGDLGLISDDSLRSSITAYLETMRNSVRAQESSNERFSDEAGALFDLFDPVSLGARVFSPEEIATWKPEEPLQVFPEAPGSLESARLDVGELLARDETRALLWRMDLSKRKLLHARTLIDSESRALLVQLENELAL